MPSFTLVRDKRDNPIDPRHGSYTVLDMGMATSAPGLEANFGRVLLQNSTYYTIKKKWVFARRTQIGIEHPYGTNNFISQRDRGQSHSGRGNAPSRCRSCSSPAAAIRCAASPSTRPARAILADRIPHRRPGTVRQQHRAAHSAGAAALRRQQSGLRLLSRHGQRFDTANHILSGMLPPAPAVDCQVLGAQQHDSFAISATTRRPSGMGIRYKTPVGPVRFDLGYNFNPTRYPIQETGPGASRCAASTYFSVLDRLSDETHYFTLPHLL